MDTITMHTTCSFVDEGITVVVLVFVAIITSQVLSKRFRDSIFYPVRTVISC